MPLQTLQKYYGYPSFRPGQLEIINSILAKKDTLAIMPTGGGKSICFQVPGLKLKGTTLVISPLISLMQDQVQALIEQGISACFINSSLTKLQLKTRLELIRQGHFKFVYLAPERLSSKRFIKICQKIEIALIAVDEAHCASIWGHDFRPSYQQIAAFSQQLLKSGQKLVMAAFTATATPTVKQDIIQLLKLKQPQIFTHSFERKNLFLKAVNCSCWTNKLIALIQILKKHQNQSGIIYGATRLETETTAKLINHLNFKQNLGQHRVLAYHGAMSTEQREIVQAKFISNKAPVITATNAFGMGVDKSDVRFVIHYQIPASIENYYQEVGRAGRDQQSGFCYLLLEKKDVQVQQEIIYNSGFDKKRQKLALNKLNKMTELAQSKNCLSKQILDYFGQKTNQVCLRCSSCNQFNPTKISKLISLPKKLILLKKLELNLTSPPLPNLRTKKLINLLQPQNLKQLKKIPGVGQGLIKAARRDRILSS